MKRRIDSRTSQIDTERCVANTNGRYDLVLVAANRLRDLKRQNREPGRTVTSIDALLDVQAGAVDLTAHITRIK